MKRLLIGLISMSVLMGCSRGGGSGNDFTNLPNFPDSNNGIINNPGDTNSTNDLPDYDFYHNFPKPVKGMTWVYQIYNNTKKVRSNNNSDPIIHPVETTVSIKNVGSLLVTAVVNGIAITENKDKFWSTLSKEMFDFDIKKATQNTEYCEGDDHPICETTISVPAGKFAVRGVISTNSANPISSGMSLNNGESSAIYKVNENIGIIKFDTRRKTKMTVCDSTGSNCHSNSTEIVSHFVLKTFKKI
jgi:hypothetical protein